MNKHLIIDLVNTKAKSLEEVDLKHLPVSMSRIFHADSVVINCRVSDRHRFLKSRNGEHGIYQNVIK